MSYAAFNRLINPATRSILRSPLHALLSGSLMLLTYRGRRSGRSYTVPVQYARTADRLIVYPGRAERKSWWRNLIGGAPVTVTLRGRRLTGTGTAVTDDPQRIADGIRAFIARFPSTARSLGVDPGEPGKHPLPAGTVIVEIVLAAGERERG